MLDPRSLAERRDEIVESCRRRGVTADVDAAVRAQQAATALQTELNLANQRRNEHQAAGQRKLPDDLRAAHAARGRELKQEVAELEAKLAAARDALDAHLLALPNFVHPDAPVGGEQDFRELRRVGEPRRFDFQPQDHVAIAERLALVDF
jgi:seryl-tRNA synthetase